MDFASPARSALVMLASIGTWGRDWAPTIVAAAALLFSLMSFWWMNARVGRLIVAAPRSYAVTTKNDRLILLLPLVFFNTGPVAYVVRDLRIRFADEDDAVSLDFHRVRQGVSPAHHPDIELSAAFPVSGRTAVRLFCEFERRPVGRTMKAGHHALLVEALTDKDDDWHVLLEFTLHVDGHAAAVMPKQFISFRNLPL